MRDRHTSFEPSPALLEAQRRLEKRKEELLAERGKAESSKPARARQIVPTRPKIVLESGQQLLEKRRRQEALDQGLHASDALRAFLWASVPNGGHFSAEKPEEVPKLNCAPDQQTKVVKIYPDVAMGILRYELAAPGRIWLLLRYLDTEGQGRLRIDIIRHTLTSKNSKYRVCGWRQLRNLLHQGQGIFWHRDREYVWLRSAAKVAAALDVQRLTGRPVALPISPLLGGIGDVRAHLYASFHGGRVKATRQDRPAMPIARETLRSISGVGRRTQRAYEQRVGLKVQHHFAIGERSGLESRQKRAWQQGRALFELKDYRGQQGKQRRTYLAWQLPNTYESLHDQRPKGQQKRINRELADLFMKGMTGNGEEGVDLNLSGGQTKYIKHYYGSGTLAAKAFNRDPGRDLYWRRGKTASRRFGMWQVIPASEK